MDNSSKKAIITWLLIGCVLVYAMVLIGGITRLTHSGLSMVEWNMIVGSLPPSSAADWHVLFEKYKLSPEYQQLNNHFGIEEFKSIFWWEYIHRFLGRLIGLIFIVPFVYFLVKKKITGKLLRDLTVILFLGAFQGVLGWYMVKSGLVKNPHVSHYRLAAHLISAFTVFGFTFWVALGLVFRNNKSLPQNKKLINWSYVLLITVVCQIIYGAFVAGLKAGYYYPTFPKMGNEWIADGVTTLSPIWKNFLEGIPGVQFIHRYLAYLVVVIVVVIYILSKKEITNPLQKVAIQSVSAIVIMQFLLGVFTLIYSVPVSLGVLHQTGAFLLFSASIFLLFQFKNPVDYQQNRVDK